MWLLGFGIFRRRFVGGTLLELLPFLGGRWLDA